MKQDRESKAGRPQSVYCFSVLVKKSVGLYLHDPMRMGPHLPLNFALH